MKNFVVFVVNLFLLFSCSHTSYKTTPDWGYQIKPGASFIVRITDENHNYVTRETEKAIHILKECTIDFMPIKELDSLDYRYLLHLEESWIPDSASLKKLSKVCNYDYFLTGGWAFRSDNTLPYYYTSNYENNNNLDPGKRKEQFVYLLYSLKEQQLVLKLVTNSRSVSMGIKENSRFRLPMNTETKALLILKDKLGCNYY